MTSMQSQKNLLMDVLKQDWFLVIVLDACRPDSFRRWISKNRRGLLKRLKTVRSEGRRTPLWFTKTFGGKKLDLTYISGNPYINSAGVTSVGSMAKNCFTTVIDAWKVWDKKEQTCMPQTVNRFALRNKKPRLIVHYMQPHQPYVGKKRLPPQFYYRERWHSMDHRLKERPTILQVHQRRFNKRAIGLIRAAYESNVDLVCSHAFKLVDEFKRTAVITADHSEMMGENGKWFHNCNHPNLNIVPWLRAR